MGGALLLIGLFTSPVAFILSGLMAFAYFLGHAPKGFYPLINGGSLAVGEPTRGGGGSALVVGPR